MTLALRFSILLLLFAANGKCEERSVDVDWESLKPEKCVNDVGYKRPSSPITVSEILIISAVYDISEENLEFKLDITLWETWVDPALNLTRVTIAPFRHEMMPSYFDKCIWKPDTIFHNAKDSKLYGDTLPNKFTALIEFYGKTSVLRSGRYMVTVRCSMKFHLYPLDSQFCSLEIGLLASKYTDVKLTWVKDNPVINLNKIKPLNFDIQLLNATIYTDKTFGRETLLANMVFVRSVMASVVNTYVPSFLVVCLSFVSFWLHVDAVPGRVTLGVTAILTLATSINQARSSLPTLDYMTAMDVWLLGCMITVFLSLIEFTLAQSWSRNALNSASNVVKISPKEKTINAWADQCVDVNMANVKQRKQTDSAPPEKATTKKTAPVVKKDNILDRVSRVFFPLAFIGFTTIYWVYFMSLAYK